MQIQPPIINIFEKAVRKAGKSLMRDFGEIENLQIQSKNIGDFVTNADFNSEKILLETLKYFYPDSTYVTEESNKQLSNQLSEIDSTIKVGNLINTINTYQNYKTNRKLNS